MRTLIVLVLFVALPAAGHCLREAIVVGDCLVNPMDYKILSELSKDDKPQAYHYLTDSMNYCVEKLVDHFDLKEQARESRR